MDEDLNEDQQRFTVVVNAEGQYSLWSDSWLDGFTSVPRGWKEVGVRGPKAECLSHIDEVWKDQRPVSLQNEMELMSKTNNVKMVDDLWIKWNWESDAPLKKLPGVESSGLGAYFEDVFQENV